MIFGISKTSIAGVLSFLMATLTALIAFQAPSALMTAGASHVWLIVTTVATLIVSLLRVWIGLLQGDAPTAKDVTK
jgi:hypothetical protein